MNPFVERLTDLVGAADPDRALQISVSALIEANAMRFVLGKDKERWAPGKPLKLLLAGYVGTRNTGADVRVEEMIRQFRHVIGDDQLEMSVLTSDFELSAGYFRAVRQVKMPQLFPKFLFDECPKHHGVVACEGSMFKSKFASALTCMMAGSLGMAAAENKISVGYGAEAGDMTDSLNDFVRRQCKSSLVICRNEPSRDVLGKLGVRTTSGADTAWTFDCGPLDVGRKMLEKAGWDGKKPVVAVAAINPFWWPVKPDLVKAAAWRFTGEYKNEHYKSIYFHESSSDRDEKYEAYIEGIATALGAFTQEKNAFPVMIGMEKLDRGACQDISDRLGGEIPMFISDEHRMYEMISVLRNCSQLVSSRFHAIVTSMPGLLPSGGITMDERIRNLMNDRGQPELFLEVDDDGLSDRILSLMRLLDTDAERIADGIGKAIPRQLELMGNMGLEFADEVQRVYPEFPRKELPRSWEHHLPELPKVVADILEKNG
ncbi:MAG: polysaccharide pyruvyl transferase WcaK-like protein [Myxococcota bacterium]|jgi:polysaccharide pyruvyl transferase WcaK-like protein